MDTKLRTELRSDGWIVNDDGVCVAKMNDGWHEYQESAAFIVRACNAHDDLLAACKKLEAFDERIGKWLARGNLEPMWYDDLLVAMDELRAAIAAAEGGQG
jgi:hypothetical protein